MFSTVKRVARRDVRELLAHVGALYVGRITDVVRRDGISTRLYERDLGRLGKGVDHYRRRRTWD